MEVFPERDGNRDDRHKTAIRLDYKSEWRSSLKGMETRFSLRYINIPPPVRPNGGLPWKGWKQVFLPEGVSYDNRTSEWRSSLKGMETQTYFLKGNTARRGVRMEVFPERDGNLCFRFKGVELQCLGSEWRSSLKGMETCYCNYYYTPRIWYVRMEVFPERDGNLKPFSTVNLAPNGMSEWRSSLKGMETWVHTNISAPHFWYVRMEVFPERDGNLHSRSISIAVFNTCPNGGLPWKGWKPQTLQDSWHRYLQPVRMEVFPERDGNIVAFRTKGYIV